jgi:hypothetical protein
MASNLSDSFAIYPMVEESEATGVVAGVYAELLTRMPFVPSLFKSFALCPQDLVLAHEQAAGVLDGDELEQSGQELGASVRDVVQPPGQPLPVRPVQPDEPAPSHWDAPAPAVYGEIRAALDTPVINTIWRQLAAAGQLEQAWATLGPQVEASRRAADHLQSRGIEAARRLPWTVIADRTALDSAGIADAAPGLSSVLDAYTKTLPRLLVLASSSSS